MFSKKMSSIVGLASLVVNLNFLMLNASFAANSVDPKIQAAIEAQVSQALGTKNPVNLYPMQFNWHETRPIPFYNLVPDNRTGIAVPGSHFSNLADHPDHADSFEARVSIQSRGDIKTVQVFNGRNQLTRGYVVNTKLPTSDPKRVLFAMVVDNDSVVTTDIIGFPDRVVMGRAEAITKVQAQEYRKLLTAPSARAKETGKESPARYSDAAPSNLSEMAM